MTTAAVLGAGSWGTALAIHLAAQGHAVRLWSRRPDFAERLERERVNERYLPGAAFPASLEATGDLAAAAASDLVLVVVPSHGFREAVRALLVQRPAGSRTLVVSGTKGVETESTARMSQVAFEEGLAADREVRFAVLSGPTFATELVAGSPTAAVIAAEDGELAGRIRRLFVSPRFRLYTSPDVVGVELGGAAKNVIALAAGLVSGLGLGHNTLAALITRGLHEITRLGIACGGQARTFSGLAGLGDLVLTSTGGLSRNRRTGLELAKGRTLAEIQADSPMVAEGVRNALSLARLADRRGIEMPITEQMRLVLYEDKAPGAAVEALMTRGLKSESEL